jgi:hypothetical protein
MANEFAKNIQDASLNPATFALPTTLLTAGSKTSAAVDLGADTVKPENIEVELLIPTLNSTMMPAAATGGVVYSIETGVTSTFSDGAARIIASKTIAGSASGVAQTALRCRIPSDCERYIRARVALPTTGTDASAVAGTLTLRF